MIFDKVFISTYTFIYKGCRTNNSGPVIPLINFFITKSRTIYLLEQPLPGSDYSDVVLTIFKQGNKVDQETISFFFSKMAIEKQENTKTYVRLKLRDLLSNFYFFIKKRNNVNGKIGLFIGVECVNAICGIILRKLGLVDKVIYYIFDWAPDRYRNSVMNTFYILLDKIATYYSDYTWNITYTISVAKEKILHYDRAKMSPQLYVPYCVDFDYDKILPFEKLDNRLVIYSGGLLEENGPQILVRAFKIVLEKFPDAKLLIIGGGNIEKELKQFIKDNNLEKNIQITGYIADVNEIIRLQSKGVIGVAPYPIIRGSRKPYGDVIKIRMYFACGLVTVTTPVPPISKEIKYENLGYCTFDDSPDEIAKGICLFLEDEDLLKRYRLNVIAKAKLSSWERTYCSALTKCGFDMQRGAV